MAHIQRRKDRHMTGIGLLNVVGCVKPVERCNVVVVQVIVAVPTGLVCRDPPEQARWETTHPAGAGEDVV